MFFILTWQQAKEFIRKYPIYNEIPLPAGNNPEGTQRNGVWQMDVFCFAEWKIKMCVPYHRHIFRNSMATALSSEKLIL